MHEFSVTIKEALWMHDVCSWLAVCLQVELEFNDTDLVPVSFRRPTRHVFGRPVCGPYPSRTANEYLPK